MTDNEIIKALNICAENDRCWLCPIQKKCKGFPNLHKGAITLINRLTEQNEQLKYELKMMLEKAKSYKAETENLKKQNDDIDYTIVGIMHFVDKWLDGDELKQDEVSRAVTMREKTLQIVEKQQAEIERYKGVIKLLENDVADAYKEFAERLKERTTTAIFGQGKYSYEIVTEQSIDNLVKEMTEQRKEDEGK